MALYKKESLDLLRERVDLPELLGGYMTLKRAGASFKGLCPFHEERSPSFIVQAGDTHYHCFGCGAHGDAIAFLMNHLKISFVDAVEMLAERFNVRLEKADQEERRGPSKTQLKEALEQASKFYHFCLLHAEEAHEALFYLYERGITLDFIKRFQIGFAPRQGLQRFMQTLGIPDNILEEAGLITANNKRDFFSERITFPICDAFGAVIGFSARKFKESTFGGKYINTPETPLFKKSQVLFGLHHSRARMAKERRALIVEGQIDALRLIEAGFDFTVAGQGTAFGEGHVKELIHLGVNQVFLALDADDAGLAAAVKIGHLLQKKAVAVSVIALPEDSDPDQLLREKGPEDFSLRLEKAVEYLPFLFDHLSKSHNLQIPAQKTALIKKMSDMIREWEDPVMVHESLRKLSQLASVPEEVIGVGGALTRPRLIRHTPLGDKTPIDADRVLETDLLRWLVLRGADNRRLVAIARHNLSSENLRNETCKRIFEWVMRAATEERPFDLMALGSALEKEEEQSLLAEIVQKKINIQKAEEGLVEVVQRILTRQWMDERETVRVAIQSGMHTNEALDELVHRFDALKRETPKVLVP